jgi:uncharacterized membrane protein YebE (DUF533 family)
MIDPTKLLDQFLGGGGRGGFLDRREERPGPWGGQRGEGGGDLLSRARDYLGNHGGGVAGGAVAGALTSLLLGSKSGRKMAMNAAQLGAMAVIGGLAYKAYSNYRDGKPLLGGQTAAQIPSSVPTVLPGAPAPNEHAVLLLRSMIAAASSDGALDADERGRIVGQLSHAGLGSEERAWLEAEISRPWSPAEFAAATTTPEMRSELYLAATLAIEADTEAERAYLRYLAATLRLEEPLVAHLEATATEAKAPAALPPQGRLSG